eukprot:s2457_g5.t1
MKNAQLTLHSTVLLLSLGSWLLLFTVELGAVASEGEEVFHPSRLGAYITSAGFGVVTCLLLTLWCLGASGRTSYTSVMPAEEKDGEATSRSIIFWHYAIHGILVLATICWICIHSVNLQHQQVWRGILTLYSLLSLTLICFSQRKAVGRGLGDGAPMVFLRRSKGEDEGHRKPSTRTSVQSKCPSCKPERWKPLFQDPSFGGEVSQGAKPLNSRSSKRNEWRSFVFEEQAEAILSPTSAMKSGLTLPMTFQKNLLKLRGIARRGAESDQGSVRRSSFASSDQGDGSYPASPTFPRMLRTQSQPSVSSGFSDVSDCIATPSSPSLVRGISKASQIARNSVFPDDFSSPVVGLLAMAFSSSLDHLLLFPGNPLRFLAPGLVDFATTLGPLVCELTSALAESDAAWIHEDSPAMAEVEHGIEQIRVSLAGAIPAMIQWRLGLSRADGIRYDRLQHSVKLTIEELEYYDGYPPLRVIKDGINALQMQMQHALTEQTPMLRGSAPAELEASQ